MSLLYCGIDEAGYGPMLGPLCVAASLFEVDAWNTGEPAPNLWKSLRSAVSRSPKDAGKKIPIADSKKLKLPNNAARDPLEHLERSVLACMSAWLDLPSCDDALMNHLGAKLSDEPWYAGPSQPLPRSCTTEQLKIDANMLLRAGLKVGVRLVGLWCLTLCERDYNGIVEQHQTKAATTAYASRVLIERVLNHARTSEVRIVCDRQGGRVRYEKSLSGIAGRGAAKPLEESPRLCRYELEPGVLVHVQPEAEDAHLPVALASMTAKLVRELSMDRFNRYWADRVPGLRGTAGYNTDARRWLRDAGEAIDRPTRARLVRVV